MFDARKLETNTITHYKIAQECLNRFKKRSGGWRLGIRGPGSEEKQNISKHTQVYMLARSRISIRSILVRVTDPITGFA